MGTKIGTLQDRTTGDDFLPKTDASLVKGLEDLSTIRRLSNGALQYTFSGEADPVSPAEYESVTNKTTELDNESTNTEYPSAKAVVDALGKWGVVSQTLTWDATNAVYVISNPVQGLIPLYFIELVTAEGATYNATTGYFELNGITDIAYDEMKVIYTNRTSYGANNVLAIFGENYTARTNFTVFRGGSVSFSNHDGTKIFSKYLCYYNSSIVTLALTDLDYYVASGATNNFVGRPMSNPATVLSRIKKIIGIIKVNNLTGTANYIYDNTPLPQLEEFDMRGIVASQIKWAGMPKLKLSTIVNAVNYAANTAVSTWTLHADAYARCQADTTTYTYNSNTYTGILAYASAKNITIASA